MADETAGESMDQNETETTESQEERTASNFKPITSQEDFDAKVEGRLARERAKLADPSKQVISKKYYSDLLEQAEKLKEIEESNRSELERAMARANEFEQQLTQERQERQNTDIRAAILAEAAKAGRGIIDPSATVTFLTGDDRDLLEVDESGTPTNIAKAMDSLLERRDYLVAKQGGARGNADQGARTGGAGQVTESELKSMSWQQIEKARSEGRLKNLLGAS